MGPLLAGLAAGAGAAEAKNRVTAWLYEHEPDDARRREDEARSGRFAYDVLARKTATGLGVQAPEKTLRRTGQAIHWSLGIGSVVLYAFLRNRWPRVSAWHGLAFGVPFTWLLLDEAANPALGLSPPPQRFPWQTHARAAVGHVVLWITAESLLRQMDGRRKNH